MGGIGQSRDMTALLHAWRDGDHDAGDQLSAAAYEHLRDMARRRLAGERDGHTLQATALVHEAYERLIQGDVDWSDRAHFFATAALHMRSILVDHARARAAEKRGGGAVAITLHDDLGDAGQDAIGHLLLLDDALDRLQREDERTARVIELTYFGGMTREDIAGVLSISVPTVDRGLRFGRAWLRQALAA